MPIDHVPAAARTIALVGMMGSGKSAVGRIVAARVGRRCIDLDTEIETRAGRTIADVFASDGEQAFRVMELDALTSVLDHPEPTFIATGGGIVTSEAARDLLMERASVVWLDADVETLIGRVGTGVGRPLLAGDPAGALRSLDAARRPLYAEVADVVVDANAPDVDVVADRVLHGLEVLA